MDLAVEDEGEPRQAAGAGDRVDRALRSGSSSSGVRVDALPIGVLPAQWSAASSFSEQMLPRWLWSIANALGRVTASDLMLASPGRVRRSNCSVGFWPRAGVLAAAELPDRHLRLEPSEAQLTTWK